MQRVTLPLDGTWEFVPDPERRLEATRLPRGEPISVPGCWEAQLAPPYGIVHGWYSRRFTTPADWKGGALVLGFGSAMARAVVWLDGREVGANQDGYLSFEVEAGPAGPGADHEVVVEIENPVNALTDYPAFDPEAVRRASEAFGGSLIETLPHGKQTWYTSTSGLTGSVVAQIVPDARFASLVVFPDLAEAQALVRWRLAGRQTDASAIVRLSVTSPSGEIVVREATEAAACAARITISSPEAWDVGRPALYRLNAVLEDPTAGRSGPEPLGSDEVSVRFGMRSIGVAAGSVLLNGRSTYLRGALDQDFWPEGRSNPPSPEAYRIQVALAREMGLNLLRCHVKVPDPAYLDAADEAGLLVWCELPFWDRFSGETDETARRMLQRMVETMGNHPSVIAWTIINEDWGTDLRHSARDRSWLRATAEWLKEIDPTRLVVDNSACEAPGGPNFHLRTDLVDYHAYRSMPDGLPAWRSLMTDFAHRPAWLWSSFDDARPTGDEALVLSEFGGWGLPAPSAVGATEDREHREPWWWTTGAAAQQAAGIRERFEHDRLDRIWPDLDALAVETQWRQFEGLAAQLREIRRHPEIRGYVITELSDAFWEPNGLLDVGRERKAFHGRLVEINAPAVLVIDLPRTDLWAGERLDCDVVLSSFPDEPSKRPPEGGQLDWQVKVTQDVATHGSKRFQHWPNQGASVVARLTIQVPPVAEMRSAEIVVEARSSTGDAFAVYRKTVLIVPRSMRRTTKPRSVAVSDPRAAWSVRSRLEQLGHPVMQRGRGAELTVASRIESSSLEDVERGGVLLVLARSADAIPLHGPPRRVTIRPRRSTDDGDGDQPWLGDWTSVFAWALPGAVPGLAAGGLLGDAHAEIFPDHVMVGLDAGRPDHGVEVGLFAGWLHRPVALLASFPVGHGQIVATTLRLAPEAGPVATATLESLVQRTAEMAAR